jgi:hypothetical protein
VPRRRAWPRRPPARQNSKTVEGIGQHLGVGRVRAVVEHGLQEQQTPDGIAALGIRVPLR